MRVINVEQRSQEWLDLRRGKITGTVISDVYAKRGGRKIGFYQILAERLGLDPDEENRMERGLRLEEEALERLTQETGIKWERPGLCVSDFSDDIINSPDALEKKGKIYPRGAEVKCLSPARHLQVVVEDRRVKKEDPNAFWLPPEFESQGIQYFIVNDDLKMLYFTFYDPRIPSVDFYTVVIRREQVQDKIDFFKKWELDTIQEIEDLVEELTF